MSTSNSSTYRGARLKSRDLEYTRSSSTNASEKKHEEPKGSSTPVAEHASYEETFSLDETIILEPKLEAEESLPGTPRTEDIGYLQRKEREETEPSKSPPHVRARDVIRLAADYVTYDLPTYSGAIGEWTLFKSLYTKSTSFYGILSSENWLRLGKSLQGKAREAVDCMFYVYTDPAKIMEMLELRFWHPNQIIYNLFTDVEKLPKLNKTNQEPTASKINDFANKLNVITIAIKNVDERFLRNPMLTRLVVRKLSPGMKLRWYRHAAGDQEPEIMMIAAFLDKEASIAMHIPHPANFEARDVFKPAKSNQNTNTIDKAIRDMKNLPIIQDTTDEMVDFAEKLNNIIKAITSAGGAGYFWDPKLTQKLFHKLTWSLISEWCHYNDSKEYKSSEPVIVSVSKYLNRKANFIVQCKFVEHIDKALKAKNTSELRVDLKKKR